MALKVRVIERMNGDDRPITEGSVGHARRMGEINLEGELVYTNTIVMDDNETVVIVAHTKPVGEPDACPKCGSTRRGVFYGACYTEGSMTLDHADEWHRKPGAANPVDKARRVVRETRCFG